MTNLIDCVRDEIAWRNALKIGDVVAVTSGHGGGPTKGVIAGETATQWRVRLLSEGSSGVIRNAKKSSGYLIGGYTYRYRRLMPWTADIEQQAEARKLADEIDILWRRLPVRRLKLESIRALRNFLDNCVEEVKQEQQT